MQKNRVNRARHLSIASPGANKWCRDVSAGPCGRVPTARTLAARYAKVRSNVSKSDRFRRSRSDGSQQPAGFLEHFDVDRSQ